MNKLFTSRALTLLAATILLSCSEEETPPEPITYFTLNVSEIYTSGAFVENGNWVIIHDENGEIWDYATYEAGQTLVFDSIATPTGTLGVTFFEMTPDMLSLGQIKTYMNVTPGEEWTIDPTPTINPGQNLGTLSVNVSDINLGHYANGQLTNPNRNSVTQFFDFSFQASVTSNLKDLFLTLTTASGTPVYKYFKNATPGTNSLTLSDFSAFDGEERVLFESTPIYQFVVRGYPEGVPYDPEFGFITNLIWDGIFTGVPNNDVRLGFLNEFKEYHILGFAYYTDPNDYRLEYEYYGSAPTQPIVLLNNYGDLSVTNKTVDNFSVSSESAFSHLTINWGFFGTFGGNQTSVFWQVFAPTGANYTNLPELPSEITSPFSSVDFSDRTLRSVLFHKGSRTYDDIINETFKGQAKKPFDRFSKMTFEYP